MVVALSAILNAIPIVHSVAQKICSGPVTIKLGVRKRPATCAKIG